MDWAAADDDNDGADDDADDDADADADDDDEDEIKLEVAARATPAAKPDKQYHYKCNSKIAIYTNAIKNINDEC